MFTMNKKNSLDKNKKNSLDKIVIFLMWIWLLAILFAAIDGA